MEYSLTMTTFHPSLFPATIISSRRMLLAPDTEYAGTVLWTNGAVLAHAHQNIRLTTTLHFISDGLLSCPPAADDGRLLSSTTDWIGGSVGGNEPTIIYGKIAKAVSVPHGDRLSRRPSLLVVSSYVRNSFWLATFGL